MIKKPTDVRRQGRRLAKMLESINDNPTLRAGLHREMMGICDDLAEYKES